MYNRKAIKLYEQGLKFQQGNRLAEAEKAYKKALRISDDFVEAYTNLGNVLVDRNKPADAIVAYKKALNLLPGHPMILSNIGNALFLMGKYETALEHVDRAIEQDAGYADAHNNRGNILSDLSRYEEAVGAYQQALTTVTDNPEIYCNLGNTYIHLEMFEQARAAFERALNIMPTPLAHIGLGRIGLLRGQTDQAFKAFQQALALAPDNYDALVSLAELLIERGHHSQAMVLLEKARKQQRMRTEAYRLIGDIKGGTGDYDAAMAAYQKALDINPADEQANLAIGYLHSDYGDQQGAVTVFRKIIENNPRNTNAYRVLGRNHRYTSQDELADMEGLYADAALSRQQRMHLCFALGKGLEDLGEYKRAVGFIIEANTIKHDLSPYAIDEGEKQFRAITSCFTDSLLAGSAEGGCQDETPLFIVGMPRSGTSLVEQILSSHPDVYGAGELKSLSNTTAELCRQKGLSAFPDCIPSLDGDSLQQLGEAYIGEIRQLSSSARFITDKMPYNFLRIGLIRLILPHARIVYCHRDPMDNCLSLYKNYFTSGNLYSYDMGTLGQYYRLHQELMAHWQRLLPDSIHEVKYEHMVSSPEQQTRALLDACGLPWDEACLQFHKTRRRVATASNAQVRSGIYHSSVALWKNYAEELAPLQQALEPAS